jgi:hypothetical protein
LLSTHDAEDAKAKPQGLKLPYKHPHADDVAFNFPTDIVSAYSIEDNSNDDISPDAEYTAHFESGQEAVEDSDDAHVVMIQNPGLCWRL